ncbi:MAG: hypothetical protein V7641_2425 [Blastocatellia bacterium]
MRKATNSTLEEDISEITLKRVLLETLVINLWANGESPQRIASATGQPVKRIYQLLKQRQKAIIEEDGGIHHEKKNDT